MPESKWHAGPYMHISPSGFAGLLAVAAVAFGFFTLFSEADLWLMLAAFVCFIGIMIVMRILIIKRLREKQERESLLSKEQAMFETIDNSEEHRSP